MPHPRDHFDAIVGQLREPLYRFLRSRTRDDNAADDLLQETLLRAWLHLDQLNEQEKFKSWIFQIALNTARSRARRHARTPTIHSVTNSTLDSDEPMHTTVLSLPDERHDPVKALLRLEERQIIHRLLAGLPLRYREVLVLKFLEGLSQRQIAHTLGISDSAVSFRVARAIAHVSKTAADLRVSSYRT